MPSMKYVDEMYKFPLKCFIIIIKRDKINLTAAAPTLNSCLSYILKSNVVILV